MSGDKMHSMEDHIKQEDLQPSAVENIEALFEAAKQYGKTNIDLLKLKAVDKTAEIVSSAVVAIVAVIIMLLFFIILSVGLALLLGEWLGKNYYGFFALAGLYLVIGLILFKAKDRMFKVPVANVIISKLFK